MNSETKQNCLIAAIQFNPIVGDISGNIEKISKFYQQALEQNPMTDLVVFQELAICGYPPEDLILRPVFIDEIAASWETLKHLSKEQNAALLVGTPYPQNGKIYNAALLFDQGEIIGPFYKYALPNYSVFDEKRVFAYDIKDMHHNLMTFKGHKLGVVICEDLWLPDLSSHLKEYGAEGLICINGSPFEQEKHDLRFIQAMARFQDTSLPLLYVNQHGGQDELVFDGASFAINEHGEKILQLADWENSIGFITIDEQGNWKQADETLASVSTGPAALYEALICGLRDYVEKNNFPGVILGLSGGIDSALVACVAVDALGTDRVKLVMIPSPYTSQESLDDAAKLAENLNCPLENIAISNLMKCYEDTLQPFFKGLPEDLTEENLQSRMRGTLLMALSNKFGHMVVATGNKSEMATGYATLYGDMCGGYALLKDIYKTSVYDLCLWRNKTNPKKALGPLQQNIIPENIITKAPSAELKHDQSDQDTLPPYDELDAILQALIEEEKSFDEITDLGYGRETVEFVNRKLKLSEYKRRQAPPGVKVTTKAFGKERRYPITNAFEK